MRRVRTVRALVLFRPAVRTRIWEYRPGQLKSQSQIFFQTLQSQISTDFFPCRLEICTVLNSNDTGDEPYVREHAGHGTSILGIKEISARGSREEWTGLHWIYK